MYSAQWQRAKKIRDKVMYREAAQYLRTIVCDVISQDIFLKKSPEIKYFSENVLRYADAHFGSFFQR